jgi:hypothetical protein
MGKSSTSTPPMCKTAVLDMLLQIQDLLQGPIGMALYEYR